MTSYLASTYTVGQVVLAAQRQFGDESGVQITNEDVIRWVNAGQDEIFRRNEVLKATTYADTVAGKADYELPSGILRIQSILVNGFPVEQRSTQEIEEYLLKDVVGTGQPTVWAEWGGTITFYPTPDTSVANGITLKYVKNSIKVSEITDFLTIPDAYYNRLVEYVLQQAYEMDENFAAVTVKASQFDSGMGQQSAKDQVTPNTYPTITIQEEDL